MSYIQLYRALQRSPPSLRAPPRAKLTRRLFASRSTSAPPKPRPASKTSSPSKARPSPPTPSTATYVGLHQSLIVRLASQPQPTTLYFAEPSLFRLSCMTVSSGCFMYGLYHIYDKFFIPHPGLWWGIPLAFGFTSLVTLALGGWVGLTARNLIAKIEAVPHTRVGGGRTVLIRLHPQRIGPWAPGRPYQDALVEDVRLLETLRQASPGSDWRTGRRLNVREWEEQMREEETVSGWQRGISRFLAQFGRMFHRDGFVGVEVRGPRGWEGWRMDLQKGVWGRELGELLQVRT